MVRRHSLAGALCVANPSIENESHAHAFGCSGEHGIERGAVDVPAGTARHEDEVVVERCGAAPCRSGAVHFPVVLFLKTFPHAEMLKDWPGRGRQGFADPQDFVARRFDHDDRERRSAGTKREGSCRAAGSAADDSNVKGRGRSGFGPLYLYTFTA